MGVDTTLWPSNSAYLTACVNLASGIVNMSQDSLCHVQLPQLQSSTTGPTVIKHRRTLEDMFTTQKLDVTTPVLLRFEKTESQKNDSRKSAQQCIAASSTNYKVNGFADTDAVKSSTIGPAPLIKTSQMLGYDPEDGSMSAGLRTEQKLGFNHVRSPQVLFLDLEAILKKKPLTARASWLVAIYTAAVGPFQNNVRKGVPVHCEILKSYAAGLSLGEGDAFLFIDVLPNRMGGVIAA